MSTNNWRTTPCVNGRLATEDDCNDGSAAFFLIDSGDFSIRPTNLGLPRLAEFRDGDSGAVQTVVVIQAEEHTKEAAGEWELLIGYRTADGGLGVCSSAEITWVDDAAEFEVSPRN